MPQSQSKQPASHEQSIALTRDFRLLQKRRGHRYSVDDMIVAQLAASFYVKNRLKALGEVLDLGCGLGSVLLIMAWAFKEAYVRSTDTEAQNIARFALGPGCK